MSILAELIGKLYSCTSQPSDFGQFFQEEPCYNVSFRPVQDNNDIEIGGAGETQIYCYHRGPEGRETVVTEITHIDENSLYIRFYLMLLYLELNLPEKCPKLHSFGKAKSESDKK